MSFNEITNIKIEHIYPHPENPRKELGDITELAESIKKNGIMQNLTVIPGHYLTEEEWNEICRQQDETTTEERKWTTNRKWINTGYTLLIGHRRCAAAKLAGITELPCKIIQNMDEKEQLSTMLEENMQRNDLTIIEQAQGFQLMLDLGETENSISQKTGFSKQTIKHRLNIAKLDQEELKKKQHDDSFQLTLKDLYELEKIEDIKTRDKILKESRSSKDLVWKAQSAVKDAERKKKTTVIVDILKKMGIKKAPDNVSTEIYNGKWEVLREIELDKEVPKEIKIKKTDEPLYYDSYWKAVRILKKTKKEKKKATPEEIARKEREKNKKEIKNAVLKMDSDRKLFIRN